jgi:hypothetical protein
VRPPLAVRWRSDRVFADTPSLFMFLALLAEQFLCLTPVVIRIKYRETETNILLIQQLPSRPSNSQNYLSLLLLSGVSNVLRQVLQFPRLGWHSYSYQSRRTTYPAQFKLASAVHFTLSRLFSPTKQCSITRSWSRKRLRTTGAISAAMKRKSNVGSMTSKQFVDRTLCHVLTTRKCIPF